MQNGRMASDWVAPVAAAASGVAGIFFTWLSGNQSRKQAERLAVRTEQTATSNATLHERRDAYLSAMRCVRLDIQRLKYKEKGEDSKLDKIEETWPKGERVRMAIEARIAVETFGTSEASDFAQDLLDAMSMGDRATLQKAYERFVSVVRRDLGVPDIPNP